MLWPFLYSSAGFLYVEKSNQVLSQPHMWLSLVFTLLPWVQVYHQQHKARISAGSRQTSEAVGRPAGNMGRYLRP